MSLLSLYHINLPGLCISFWISLITSFWRLQVLKYELGDNEDTLNDMPDIP